MHCCFYFVGPHRVTPLDVEFMRRLQYKVCVVPVVAKADTMTRSERARHLRAIHAMLLDERINIFDFGRSESSVDEAWLADATDDAAAADVAPGGQLRQIRNIFAVVSGQRRYEWGAANEDDRAHSDAPRLRDRLFVDGGLEELLVQTDCRHAEWVKHFRGERRGRARRGANLARELKRRWATPAVSWLKLLVTGAALFGASALVGRATRTVQNAAQRALAQAESDLADLQHELKTLQTEHHVAQLNYKGLQTDHADLKQAYGEYKYSMRNCWC